MKCSYQHSSLHIFVREDACAIKVYSVLPVGMNEEQNLGEILVMFFFPGHLGLAFDVNGYSAVDLSASEKRFQ